MTTTTSMETDPTKARYVKSYAVRRAYQGLAEVQYPPDVPDVTDTIDIHCHAHQGTQDPVAVAKHASKNKMRGILYKTLAERDRPTEAVQRIQEACNQWCESEGITPITCWSGYNCAHSTAPPSSKKVREQLDLRVTAIWMPVAMSANMINLVGGKKIWWDRSADPTELTEALPWKEALKVGHYLLDDKGKLKHEIREIIHMVADCDTALSFGHATHPEIFAMAEEVDKLRLKRAFIDHPFSPFLDLNIEQMRQLARIGIYLNFTYDELSPLLAVDPFRMYQAIRDVGVEHFILSSDAGDPFFPNSVECMRQMRTYMQAYGLTDEEVRRVSSVNPGIIVGD